MRTSLWAGLAIAAGASFYLALQDDEADLQAVTRGEARQDAGVPATDSRRHIPATGGTGAEAVAMQERDQRELVWAVASWKQRTSGDGRAAVPDGLARTAWASQQPPPLPPPPQVDPPPPPPPMAPPFPHAWIGRYVDTVPRAVISGPSRTWVVQVGDVIDGQWRVDDVAERQLQVTYLPLQQSLTVAMK